MSEFVDWDIHRHSRHHFPVLYFAFGSNLNHEQMASRWPAATPLATAVLDNFRLVFSGHSRRWGGGVATVLPFTGAEVPGVLYTVSEEGLLELDRFEGAPTKYVRRSVRVRAPSGAAFDAWTYVRPVEPTEFVPPSPAYLNVLRDAYARLGFDPARLVAALASASDPV
jgi:gamma-glutamylcyclotransferase (GGCT)/AIG2-like uncharacterized protein YtfP